MPLGSFLRTYADNPAALQQTMDIAVVLPSVLQPSLSDALRSIFAQRFDGRIQVLVGVDRPAGDRSFIDAVCRQRPANCSVQVVYPGYSTSQRHGGLSPVQDGGVLRCVLTYLANAPYIAYLDEDNWWHPDHLGQLRRAVEGQDWAYSLRWFAHPVSCNPICVDDWESVGPDNGIFAEGFGGFVDHNCLMINKLACIEAVPWWNHPLPNDSSGTTAAHHVFAALKAHQRFAATGEATVFCRMHPENYLQSIRLDRVGDLFEKAAAAPAAAQVVDSTTRKLQPAVSLTRAATVMELLHECDIYNGFTELLPEDIQGWNSVNPVFPAVVHAIKPTVVVDVGVWKGGSTIYLADLLRQYEIDGVVIAIDTFLGSTEHWARGTSIGNAMPRRHGFPLLYWQFLSNVLHRGHASRIVPLAQSSENAAFLLRQAGVTAGLIHIDAAHDYAAVRRDIETYWELLQPGGYLVGDDYVPVWPDVIRATDEWAAELGLQLQLCGPKWFVQKPARPVGVETATAAQEG